MPHTLKVTLTGTDGTSYNISEVVPQDQVRLRRGRESAGQQAQPNSLTFTMLNSPLAPAVGDQVTLSVTTPDSPEAVWFTGRVTDSDARLAHNGTSINVVATSAGLGMATREVVGDEPWSVEGDATRISRILQLAGIPLGTIDADVTTMLARDVDRQNAYNLITAVANQSLGCLVDEADGSVSYQNNQHRDSATFVNLPTSLIPEDTGPLVSAKVGGLVNRVRLRYGPTPDGGEQPEIIEEDTASIADYGISERSLTTQLADEPNARSIAQALLRSYSEARYRSDRLTVPMDAIDPAARPALEQLQLGQAVNVPGLVPPAPDPWQAWVEGITDTWDEDLWTRELHLDDYYSQPVDIEPPPPATDCGGFDWTGSCATEDLTPKGLYFSNVGGSHVTWDWSGDQLTFHFAPVDDEDTYFYMVGIAISEVGMLASQGHTHPDPFTVGTDTDVDFCLGANVVTDLSEVTGAWVVDDTQTRRTWDVADLTNSSMGAVYAEWQPEVGWPPDAVTQQDGFAWAYVPHPNHPNPLPLPGPGCTVYPEAVVIPDTATRIDTISPGRWELGASLWLQDLPDGYTYPLFTPWGWTGGPIHMTVEYRAARSDWWHTQPPPTPQQPQPPLWADLRARQLAHRTLLRNLRGRRA